MTNTELERKISTLLEPEPVKRVNGDLSMGRVWLLDGRPYAGDFTWSPIPWTRSEDASAMLWNLIQPACLYTFGHWIHIIKPFAYGARRIDGILAFSVEGWKLAEDEDRKIAVAQAAHAYLESLTPEQLVEVRKRIAV